MATDNASLPARRYTRRGALGLVGAAMSSVIVPTLTGCTSASANPHTLRVGYFANLTHAVPMVAMARGLFARNLPGVDIKPQIFTSGPPAVAALLAGALDVAYLGPSPAVTAWVRTQGHVQVVAGAATGGAALVGRAGIRTLEDLRGKTVATPGQGGTQDVALRYLLRTHSIRIGSGRDDVNVVWMPSSQSLDQFKQGRLDAVYQAEPWVSRLIVEGGAHVVVDEATLWPQGKFATTVVLASSDYVKRCEPQLRGMLAGQLDAETWLTSHPGDGRKVINSELDRLTGQKLKTPVIQQAMSSVYFGHDPLMRNVAEVAAHTWDVGAINSQPHLGGMAYLDPLNSVLRSRGLAPIDAAGYGKETRS